MGQFQRAQRQKIKLLIGLIGPSGAGKTYSALRLARGITGNGRVAILDTEHRRGLFYADDWAHEGWSYDYLPFDPPFSPERYINAAKLAKAEGFDLLIVDSGSHEWIGTGGILYIKDKMPGANDYTKWGQLTPRHNAFLECMTHSDIHTIVTLRGKDEYVLELNSKGKQAPRKVGVGAQMRDGFEYECVCSFLIDQKTHVAEVMKDNTHIFEKEVEQLTEEHGRKLAMWAAGKAIGKDALDMAPAMPAEAPLPEQGFSPAVKVQQESLGLEESTWGFMVQELRSICETKGYDWDGDVAGNVPNHFEHINGETPDKIIVRNFETIKTMLAEEPCKLLLPFKD